jgi:hypothetical protein
MSNPSDPKGPPDAPAEGATKTFVLKIDSWLADLMKKDLETDAAPPDAAPEEPAASPPDAAEKPPSTP